MANEAEAGFGITDMPRLGVYGELTDEEVAEPRRRSRFFEIARAITMAVAGVLAAVGAVDNARADIIADFAPENLVLVPEVNEPDATTVSACAISPDHTTITWRKATVGGSSIRQAGIVANPDGTIDITTPITTVTSPGLAYFSTDEANTFYQNGTDLEENGFLVIDSVSGFRALGEHGDGLNMLFRMNRGISRAGVTTDTADIGYRSQDFPSMITTQSALIDSMTFDPALNPNPPNPEDALLNIDAVFSEDFMFPTHRCIWGASASACSPPLDTNNSEDIFIVNRIDQTTFETWTPETPMIASTPSDTEVGDCILEDENQLVLFVSKGTGGNLNLYYVSHRKDSDNDGVINFDDNCDATPNPSQANAVHPGDLEGDACDDPDMDGVFDNVDNCPDIANATQTNVIHPGDLEGDACDDPDGDGIYDSADSCPDLFDPTNVCLVSPDTGGDGPFDAGASDILPPDMPPPDQMADGPLPDVPIGADAQDGPPPDAEIPDSPPPDVSPDMPPDSGPEPHVNVDADRDMPRDEGSEDEKGEEMMTRDSGPMDPQVDGGTEMPPSPDGCGCVLAERQEETGNRVSFLALALLALLRRKKPKKNEIASSLPSSQ